MRTNVHPMEVQEKFIREELRQYEIPARGGPSKMIVVVKLDRRSKPQASSQVQEPHDRC